MAKRKDKKKFINKEKTLYDNPIFDYLKPLGNTKFSELKGYDLQDLIILLNEYYLKLRDSLGLSDLVSFGLELEFEHVNVGKVREGLIEKSIKHWYTGGDGSLEDGLEIDSPILYDKKETWIELKDVCDIACKYGKVDCNSGGHIHIGTQVLGPKKESWINFLKIWSTYENIIYRFLYGEYLTARSSLNEYAKQMTEDFWNTSILYESESESLLHLILILKRKRRYCAVNFNNVEDLSRQLRSNTIEFRSPNGTLNPVIWQNNVNLVVNILLSAKRKNLDMDIIYKRHMQKGDEYTALRWYDEIYLDQALELCDLLFHTNIDKIYFLRQYLKSFEISSEVMKKTKTFTLK